jgi:hypothetical protein
MFENLCQRKDLVATVRKTFFTYFYFLFCQRKDLVATVINLERDSKRITEVLTSITTISTAQTKEREGEARGLRHEDGHTF